MDTKPSNINIKGRLCGSRFNRAEYERIAVNIIIIAVRKKNDNWFDFSCDEYKALCDHSVSSHEIELIQEMAEKGFLKYDEEGKFSITQKFIDACLVA